MEIAYRKAFVVLLGLGMLTFGLGYLFLAYITMGLRAPSWLFIIIPIGTLIYCAGLELDKWEVRLRDLVDRTSWVQRRLYDADRWHLAIITIALIFFVLSLIGSANNGKTGHDESVYLSHMQMFLKGSGYFGYREMPWRPPLISFAFAAFQYLPLLSYSFVNPVSFLVGGLAIYFLVRRAQPEKPLAALLAAVIFFLTPELYVFSTIKLREMLGIGVAALSILCFAFQRKKTAFLFAGLSFLVAWNNIGVLFGLILAEGYLVITKLLLPYEKKIELKSILGWLLQALGAISAVLVPIILYEFYLQSTFRLSLAKGGPFSHYGPMAQNNEGLPAELLYYLLGVGQRFSWLPLILAVPGILIVIARELTILVKRKASRSHGQEISMIVFIWLCGFLTTVAVVAPYSYWGIQKGGDPARLAFPLAVPFYFFSGLTLGKIMSGIMSLARNPIQNTQDYRTLYFSYLLVVLLVAIQANIFLTTGSPGQNQLTPLEIIRSKRPQDNFRTAVGAFLAKHYHGRWVYLNTDAPQIGYLAGPYVKPVTAYSLTVKDKYHPIHSTDVFVLSKSKPYGWEFQQDPNGYWKFSRLPGIENASFSSLSEVFWNRVFLAHPNVRRYEIYERLYQTPANYTGQIVQNRAENVMVTFYYREQNVSRYFTSNASLSVQEIRLSLQIWGDSPPGATIRIFRSHPNKTLIGAPIAESSSRFGTGGWTSFSFGNNPVLEENETYAIMISPARGYDPFRQKFSLLGIDSSIAFQVLGQHA